VLVKEVRQAVRSNLFLGVLTLLLGGLAGGSLIYLISVADRLDNAAAAAGSGHLFMVGAFLAVALVITTLALLARSQQGRAASSDDLLLITTLSPGAIVRGRILSGLCAVLVILSAGLPFLTVAYLLRGVSLAHILWTAGGLLALGLVLTSWAALAAACTRPERSGLTLAVFVMLPVLLLPSLLTGVRYASPLHPSHAGSAIESLLGTGLLLSTALVCMYVVSVFMLSPRTLNRARPCRLVLSALFLGWWLLTPVLVLIFHDVSWTKVALVVLVVLILVGLVTGLLAGDPLSRRVRQEIPRGRVARLWALVFYNGTLPAVLWVTLVLGLLLLWNLQPLVLYAFPGGSALVPYTGLPGATFVPLPALLIAAGYLLLYLLVARWLSARLGRYPQFQRGEALFALVGVCFGVGSQLPWLVALLVLGAKALDAERFPLLGSLLAAFSTAQYTTYLDVHAAFLIGMLTLFAALNQGWLIGAVKAFRHSDETAPALLSAAATVSPLTDRPEVPR
jgi:hypothetical protein